MTVTDGIFFRQIMLHYKHSKQQLENLKQKKGGENVNRFMLNTRINDLQH